MKALEFYQIVSGLSFPASELGKKDIRNKGKKEKVTKYMEEVVKTLSFINSKKDSNEPFTVADLQKLMIRISNTRIALKNLKGIADDKMIENSSKQIAEIEKVTALLDVTKKMTLTEAINSTEAKNVELYGQVQMVGANSSTRSKITVTNSKNQKINGYFTNDATLFDESVARNVEAHFVAAMAKYPDNNAIKNLYNKIKKTEYGMFSLIECMNDVADLRGATADNTGVRSCYSETHMRYFGFLGKRTSIDSLNQNRELKELLVGIRAALDVKEVDKIRTQFYQYGGYEGVGLKAKSGSSIAGRTVAVSNVANILCIPNLVAKAIPISVNQNGKPVRGVFMQQATGSDFDGDNLDKTDFMRLNSESLDGDILKQIADVQVLDYICQNVDRHQNNLLYTIDNNGDISRVQGIDNDMSFGTVKPINTLTVQNGSPLHSITVVSESMANNLKRLQPETLTAALTGLGLRDEEIAAACDRLKMIKEYIEKNLNTSNNLKPGKVKIIPDNKWKTYTCDELCRAKVLLFSRDPNLQIVNNLFSRVKVVVDMATEKKNAVYGGDTRRYNAKKANEFSKEVKNEVFTNTDKADATSKEAVSRNGNMLAMISRGFVKNRNVEVEDDPGYEELQKALSDVIGFKYEPIYGKINSNQIINRYITPEDTRAAEERMRWAYQGALLKLKQTITEFIDNNLGGAVNDKEVREQIDTAKELLDATTQTEEIYREAMLEKQEEELEAIHLELIKEQHQFDTIVGALAIKIAEKLAPMEIDNAVDKILDGPIIKMMMDKDEALEELSKLASTDSEALYQGYAALVALKGKEEFKDEMHAALYDKVMAENAKNKQNAEVPQPVESEQANVEEEEQEKIPELPPVTEYESDLEDVMNLAELKEYAKQLHDFNKADYAKMLETIEKEFEMSGSGDEAIRERYARYFLMRDIVKEHDELKEKVDNYDISKVDEKTGKEYYTEVNESMNLLYDKFALLISKVKLIEHYPNEATGIIAFRNALSLLINKDLFEKAMQQRNPSAKDEDIYKSMYDVYQQKIERLEVANNVKAAASEEKVQAAAGEEKVQAAEVDDNLQLNEYENIEEFDNAEEYDAAMAGQGIIGNMPEYNSLTDTFTGSIATIKKQAGEIKDGKMDPNLFARYIANRIVLADIEELKPEEVNDFTLSELQRYTKNINHIYEDTFKRISEKSDLITNVLNKYEGCKNFGDMLENMYTVYAGEVINHNQPENAVGQNSKKPDEQEEVKTDTKKEEQLDALQNAPGI